MKMHTEQEIEQIKQQVRAENAQLLRQHADKHPKWEMHDLLKKLADEIEGKS
jgi:hypothetical protein